MATTASPFDLNTVFDPNWEEDSAQRIFSGLSDQEKKQVDQAAVETRATSLQPEGSYTPAKEREGRLTSEVTGNPLDDFEAPLRQEAPVVESEQPQESASIGKIVAGGYDLISKIKMAQSGRTGRNAREVAREKALDNQAIFQVYSAMQNRLSERGYDAGLVDVLGTHKGGGLRRAEDIDRLFKIKAEGITFQTEDGRTARLDKDAPWGDILEADRKISGIKIEGASDPVKRIKDANDALKPLLDENGSPLPGKEAVVEFLYNDIDAASGAPTGAAAYSDRYSRLLDRERKLNLANANGVNFGDISKDSIPQELANLNEQKITLAIERAPTFNMTDPADKARMQDWLSKNETSSLPFNLILPDGAGTFEATGKENVYRRWSPIEKQWKIADFNKPQPAAASEATETNSEFSRAGQTGQKIRKAGGGLVRAVRGGSTSVGETLSNVPSSAVNMGAGIVEMGAGIFNVPLKIPRSLNITDSLKKMGLQRDEDGTWGSVKK
jgi:hypothetical protein